MKGTRRAHKSGEKRPFAFIGLGRSVFLFIDTPNNKAPTIGPFKTARIAAKAGREIEAALTKVIADVLARGAGDK